MSKFEIKIDKATDSYIVSVSGVIDEDVDFTPYTLTGAKKVDFKLAAIKSINSCGIREWIKWIGSAGAAPIFYHECPKIIVDQINMVQGFLPASGKVMSFYVPYFSEESGNEKIILFTHGKEFTENSLNPPTQVKDTDGTVMEMDVVEAKYFKFIKK